MATNKKVTELEELTNPATGDKLLIIDASEADDNDKPKQIDYDDFKGEQGEQGDQGDQGNQGNQGEQGDQGTQGEASTVQGPQGDQGDQGDTGDQGATGADSTVQGPQGEQGSQGTQGEVGDQGDQGDQGAQGDDGDQGSQGEQGSQGTQGDQGEQGNQGDQGDQGLTGEDSTVQGPQGDQGEQGDQGTQGEASTVQGPQGNQGTQGNQGVTGAAGGSTNWLGEWNSGTGYVEWDAVSNGGNSYVCISNNTNQEPPNATYWAVLAEKGVQGDQGADGAQGAQGDQGDQGATPETETFLPASVSTVTGTNTAGDVDSLDVADDSDTYDVDEVIGVPGYDIRVTFTGITDFNRIIWRTQYNGTLFHQVQIQLYNVVTTNWDSFTQFSDEDTLTYHNLDVPVSTNYIDSGTVITRLYHIDSGNAFHDVVIDLCWLQLSVVAGVGIAGDQGDQGATGDQGAQGDTGAQGAKGDQGDQGDQGSQGNQGATGSQGATGDQGATGAQGTTGAQGDQGDEGSQGPQGDQGVQGSDATVPDADTTTKGKVELATNAETLAGTDTERAVTPDDMAYVGTLTGWIPVADTWTYASVDDPTGVITINADMTSKISVGMRIKFTNNSQTVYGIVTAISESGGTTTLTFLHEIDPTDSEALYLMQNSAITAPYYSHQKAPFGFPLEDTKWTVRATDTTLRTQATPTANTWYNLGPSNLLPIPIGSWKVSYKVVIQINDSTPGSYGYSATLSTANNTASDSDFTTYEFGEMTGSGAQTHTAKKELNLTTKDTYYLNTRTISAGVDNIYNRADAVPTIIKASCAYL